MFKEILEKIIRTNPANQLRRRFVFNANAEICPLYELSPLNAKYGLSQILKINRHGRKAGAIVSCAGMSVRDEDIIKDYSFCFSMASEVLDFVIIDLDGRKMDIFLQEEIINSVIESRTLLENDLHVYVCMDRSLESQEVDSMVDFIRMSSFDGIVCRDEKQIGQVMERCNGRVNVLAALNVRNIDRAAQLLSKGVAAIVAETRDNNFTIKRKVKKCQAILKNA